jgi:DNA-binding transcriptional regulator LsrR (DeoR family)
VINDKEIRRLSFLAEIASLYYEHDLTQSQIAERMFVSRSRVSRLLKQAKEKGLVDVKINFVGERYYELEQIFIRKFGLRDVRIFNSRNKMEDETLKGITMLAAQYLQEQIKEGTTLGISWGRTVYETVRAFEERGRMPIDVVQIIGSASSYNTYIDCRESVRKISRIYGGKAHYLNVPLYVEDDNARMVLLNDPFVSETMELAHNADIILTGIGSMKPENFWHLWEGYLNEDILESVKNEGAIGYLCAHFYDKWGNVLDNELNKRIVAVNISNLRKIKTVIGVAGGIDKVEAIIGAIRGKCINVLITDYNTANEILASE